MMKNAVLAVSILTTAIASAAIENVSVRQLWPWSGDVDIAFTVTGSENTAVKFTAQYDGVDPFVIPEGQLSGDFFDAAPGRRHARWRVDRAGLAGKTLFNLQITAEADATDRTYLILDLTDGSYEYAAAEPEGGWFNASTDYCKTKMVFRRVPAGTFTMGYSDDILAALDFGSYASANKARPMTISSDYYMAAYKTTKYQHVYMTNWFFGAHAALPGTADVAANGIPYNALRGSTNSPDCINWPHTGYAVATNSIIAAYRKLTEASFSPDWAIDLPTSAQWVRAARATTPDGQIWHVGGTATDTKEALTNYANQVGHWTGGGLGQSTKLGDKSPNGWGFYDFNGSAFEWGIDWAGWYGTTTDPVGKDSSSNGRMRCGAYASTKYICWMAPGYLQYYGPDNANPGYRLCIHLKRIKK